MSKVFLDVNRNDCFLKLRGIDLQELLVEIENMYIEYRDCLPLSSADRFGTEIEYENMPISSVHEYVYDNLKGWISKKDRSIEFGGEITSPILTNCNNAWKKLAIICDFLKENRAYAMDDSGAHVHVDYEILENNLLYWIRYIKLYTNYEHILSRFAYGDKISARKGQKKYADYISDKFAKQYKLLHEYKSVEELIASFNITSRFYALNLMNLIDHSKDTIEFRIFNSTSDKVIFQNNINCCLNQLLAVKKESFDEEYLDYKFNNEYLSFNDSPYRYNEINIKDSLEYVDMIYNNNLDKMYFLRQYIKSYQNNYGVVGAVKAKRFTK